MHHSRDLHGFTMMSGGHTIGDRIAKPAQQAAQLGSLLENHECWRRATVFLMFSCVFPAAVRPQNSRMTRKGVRLPSRLQATQNALVENEKKLRDPGLEIETILETRPNGLTLHFIAGRSRKPESAAGGRTRRTIAPAVSLRRTGTVLPSWPVFTSSE
jgi:hypothetical protein